MADTISPKRARKIGEEDAEIAIDIARERPLAGTPDPDTLEIAPPNAYQDSPELPARRIATEWDDYLNDDDEFVRELGIEPPNAPQVLSRFGRAKRVWIDGDDEAWSAYQDGLLDRLEEAEVRLIPTIYTVYPDPEIGSFVDIRSLYVADESRYEGVGAPGRPDDDAGEGTMALLEDHVQEAFVPRGEGRFRRWRRRRARRAR